MARRRRFNPRQPRDRNGRWTSGLGSSGSGGRKPLINQKRARRIQALGLAVGVAQIAASQVLLRQGLKGSSSINPPTIKVPSVRINLQRQIGS